MKNMKRVLVGGLALSLLMSQGVSTASAKGHGHETKHKRVTDKNKNGLPDSWEIKYKLGTGKTVAKKDNDRDGLNNLLEYKLKLNPLSKDTDKDRVLDCEEDTDKDGVSNESEIAVGLNPSDSDTDNDRIKDGKEVIGKDGIKLTDKIRSFELEIETSTHQEIEVEYKFSKSGYFLKVKDSSQSITKDMINTLVNKLETTANLTEEQLATTIQSTLQLKGSFKAELEIKYFNGDDDHEDGHDRHEHENEDND
jgi:hypothetical protein